MSEFEFVKPDYDDSAWSPAEPPKPEKGEVPSCPDHEGGVAYFRFADGFTEYTCGWRGCEWVAFTPPSS